MLLSCLNASLPICWPADSGFHGSSLSAQSVPYQSVPDQSVPDHLVFSRLNSFGAFGEYSNDSSRILLGNAQQRKLLNLGFSYSRRILLRPSVDLQYIAEVRPVLFESDLVVHVTQTFTFSNYSEIQPSA